MRGILIFIILLSTQLWAETITCDDPIISRKCDEFIYKNELMKFNQDYCKTDPGSCLCNLHDPFDRSLREYDQRAIIEEYEGMVDLLNKDQQVREWFDRTDGLEPTYTQCKGSVRWSDCKAYNAFCMSGVLRISMQEDLKKFATHINNCSNPAYIKYHYIDDKRDRYPELTQEERRDKALEKCRRYHRHYRELKSYIPTKRGLIHESKLPHTKEFFDRALQDMQGIPSLEDMENKISNIELQKEQTKNALRAKTILERCREQRSNDVYNRDIQGNIISELDGYCTATALVEDEAIAELVSDWDKIKGHMTDEEMDDLNKNIALGVLADAAIATWKHELCNKRKTPFTKLEAVSFMKGKLPNYKNYSAKFNQLVGDAFADFETRGLNKSCIPSDAELRAELDKLNKNFETMNEQCALIKQEYDLNRNIVNRIPGNILDEYTRPGLNTRFSKELPNDFYNQVVENPSKYQNKDYSNTQGKYDKDFFARTILAEKSGGDPSIFINPGQENQPDLQLYFDGLSHQESHSSCKSKTIRERMDYYLDRGNSKHHEKIYENWQNLIQNNPSSAALLGMDAIKDNLFNDQYMWDVNLRNWIPKFCNGGKRYTPFKNISLDQFKKARAEMSDFVAKEMNKLNTYLDPNNIKARNENVFSTLKSRPGVMAELLAQDSDGNLGANTCQLIDQIYSEDKSDRNTAYVLGGLAGAVGIILMFTGVGSPAGAALLGASVALTSAEMVVLKNNYDKAKDEKVCIQRTLSTGIEDDVELQLTQLVEVDERVSNNKVGLYIAAFGLGFDAIEGALLIGKLSRLQIVKNVLKNSDEIADTATWNKISKQIKSGLEKLNKGLKRLKETDPDLARVLEDNIQYLNSEQIATLGLLLRNTDSKQTQKLLKFLSDSTPEGLQKILNLVSKYPDQYMDAFGRLDFKLLKNDMVDPNIVKADNVTLKDIDATFDVASGTIKVGDHSAETLARVIGKDSEIYQTLGKDKKLMDNFLSEANRLKCSPNQIRMFSRILMKSVKTGGCSLTGLEKVCR